MVSIPKASFSTKVVAVDPVSDSCEPLAPKIFAKEIAALGAEATCSAWFGEVKPIPILPPITRFKFCVADQVLAPVDGVFPILIVLLEPVLTGPIPHIALEDQFPM